MKGKRPASLLAVLLLLPAWLPAQIKKLIVHPPDALVVKRGSTATSDLNVAVLQSFHVNSDKPRDQFLIPIKLTWTSGPLKTESVAYPNPEEISLAGETVTVFTGEFPIKTKFSAPQNAAAGKTNMTGKLRYQACNNQMCFRPETVDVTLPVTLQ